MKVQEESILISCPGLVAAFATRCQFLWLQEFLVDFRDEGNLYSAKCLKFHGRCEEEKNNLCRSASARFIWNGKQFEITDCEKFQDRQIVRPIVEIREGWSVFEFLPVRVGELLHRTLPICSLFYFDVPTCTDFLSRSPLCSLTLWTENVPPPFQLGYVLVLLASKPWRKIWDTYVHTI